MEQLLTINYLKNFSDLWKTAYIKVQSSCLKGCWIWSIIPFREWWEAAVLHLGVIGRFNRPNSNLKYPSRRQWGPFSQSLVWVSWWLNPQPTTPAICLKQIVLPRWGSAVGNLEEAAGDPYDVTKGTVSGVFFSERSSGWGCFCGDGRKHQPSESQTSGSLKRCHRLSPCHHNMAPWCGFGVEGGDDFPFAPLWFTWPESRGCGEGAFDFFTFTPALATNRFSFSFHRQTNRQHITQTPTCLVCMLLWCLSPHVPVDLPAALLFASTCVCACVCNFFFFLRVLLWGSLFFAVCSCKQGGAPPSLPNHSLAEGNFHRSCVFVYRLGQ